MPQSYVEYSSGLTATTYNIPFKFISVNDVNVKGYNGSNWSDNLTVASRSSQDSTITLDAAPSAYQKIRVYRGTSTEQLVDFQNGSRLSESDLDTAYQQGLFVAQEVSENASTEVEGIGQQGPQGIQGPAGADGADGADGVDAAGGKVLQVLHSSVTDRESITCTANVYEDTQLTLNITPSSTSSKILVFASLVHGNTGGNYPTYMRVAREMNATTTGITTKLQHFGYVANGENNTGSCSCTVMDDPQTANQLTYKAQISRVTNGTAHFNGNYFNTGFTSTLTAMEIAG